MYLCLVDESGTHGGSPVLVMSICSPRPRLWRGRLEQEARGLLTQLVADDDPASRAPTRILVQVLLGAQARRESGSQHVIVPMGVNAADVGRAVDTGCYREDQAGCEDIG